MKSKTLTSNFIFSLINQLLAVLLPLITAPYVARVLGSVGNGQFSYATSIAQYFVVFSSLGFASYGQREIAKCGDDLEKRSKVFFEIFLMRLLPSILSFVTFLILGAFDIFNISSFLLMFAVSVNILAVALDLTFFFQGLEEFKLLAIRTIIIRIVLICAIFLFVKSEQDVWIYALCSAGSSLGANLIMWISLKGKLKKIKFRDLQFKKHLKPVFLLFLPNIAITLYTILDKTMINIFTPGSQEYKDYSNGCYEQAYKINSLSLIFITVISPIFQSRNSVLYARNENDKIVANVEFATDYVWRLSLPLVCGFVVLSSNLTSWFFGSGYEDVPLLMIIMSPRFVFSGFIEIFTTQTLLVVGKEKFISISTWIAAVVNFILNLILIRYIGAVGAAIATAICEFCNFLFVFIIAVRLNFISFRKFFISAIKPFIASIIMLVAIFVVQYYWNYSIISFFVITILGAIIYGGILLVLRDKFALFAVQKAFSIIKRYVNNIKGRIKK